ncbi:MAG: hypothetical protein L6Q71_03795 [Planctomycetes bacterium]|nr:hypothetical protein [Planctomycetota bacterium]NUQ35770.1 hypothetical protein [Planctomycetaceae bacterium]
MSEATIHDVEFFRYSSFVGDLLGIGAIAQKDASLMLVDAFWDKERRNSHDEGIDLDAQVREFFPNYRRDVETSMTATRR